MIEKFQYLDVSGDSETNRGSEKQHDANASYNQKILDVSWFRGHLFLFHKFLIKDEQRHDLQKRITRLPVGRIHYWLEGCEITFNRVIFTVSEALLLSWHYHCGNWQECLKHYLLFVHHEPSGLGQFPCQFQTSTVWVYKEAGWAEMDAVLGCKKLRFSGFALLSFLSFNRLIPGLFLSALAPITFPSPQTPPAPQTG